MGVKVFTDYHHSSLLKSLQLLFEDRLGFELYRPIGLEWYQEDFWRIFNHPDTANQYLSLDQAYIPTDGSPQLNQLAQNPEEGVYLCKYPGEPIFSKACTLEYFKENKFDFVIASIPAHIEPFKRLIQMYQPQAKLIFQVGNDGWNFHVMDRINVLASVAPKRVSDDTNAIFYHQEIDLKQFYATPAKPTNKFYSFINIAQNGGEGWDDFLRLEDMTAYFGTEWRSFGGQCRDGCMTGDIELANKMREAMFISHLKKSGDGFGHIIHDAYAVGRPVITRSSYNRGKLAEFLLVPGTFIDLDEHSLPDVKNMLHRIYSAPELLEEMGNAARARFEQLVDYADEAAAINQWLNTLY